MKLGSKKQGHQIGRKKNKTMSKEDMIMYTEEILRNSQTDTKLLELISEFSKAAG